MEELKNRKTLVQILLEQKFINKKQLQEVLKIQMEKDIQKRFPIAQILIEKKICTPEQIIEALEIQRKQ